MPAHWESPQQILESIMQLEWLHRTPGSYDYQGCERPGEACGHCLFLREWAAYKMEKLGIEGVETMPGIRKQQDLGYICISCAKARGGQLADNHSATMFVDECRQCKNERALCHWTDYGWADLDRDRRAKSEREL